MQARNGHGSVQRTPRAGSAAYSHACAPKLGRRGLPLHIATRELHAAGSKSTIRSSQLRLARLSRGPRNRSAPSGAAHSLAKVVASTANHMRKSCNRQHLARHSGGSVAHSQRASFDAGGRRAEIDTAVRSARLQRTVDVPTGLVVFRPGTSQATRHSYCACNSGAVLSS